jgi:hypothetical protein
VTREQAIEEMAKVNDPSAWEIGAEGFGEEARFLKRRAAERSLAALCALIPGLSDLLAGKAEIVPVEATQEMADACFRHMILRNSMKDSIARAIAANPYRRKP